MLKNKPTFRWIHELMKEMNMDIACIRFGNIHVITVTCPEISREFLRKQDTLFVSRPMSISTEMTTKGYLSTALVPYGEQWKKMRRIVSTHVVSPAKLRKMVFNKRFFREGSEAGGPGLEAEKHIDAIFKVLAYMYSLCVSDYVPCLRGMVDLDGHEKVMKENIWDYRQELMVATVDNPSNAVEWALAEMINQPKILGKAIEELDRVVGKERLVQESDFSQLNYIKACAREAFRLHPIAPFNVPHVARSDTTVAYYFIPKGSHVLLSRSGLGRNPKAWPDETLKLRHLKDDDGSEVVLTENDLRFILFSTGRRGCIGVTLGTSMTVMLFARLLQGFTWTAPPNESKIDLSEAEDSLALAKPLITVAKPRLAKHVYPAET
ncbi:hypothetical protein EZV62_026185 [Acer yangbiense]|uniref:Tyrosine N-monooxygenase n=1 Tax=Acer yangbiense TaxID=1000413 RepID=A0A5C7GQ05_9ROSI|nr:hypothetical protein EZV62_026185 [Acer yangbiense]